MKNEELAILIQEGRTELKTELWQNVEKVVNYLAYRLYLQYQDTCKHCGVELEDVKQEAYFAFEGAINAFVSQKNLKFTSYLNLQLKRIMQKMTNTNSKKKRPLNMCGSLDDDLFNNDADKTTVSDTIADITSEEAFDLALHNIDNDNLKEIMTTALLKCTEFQNKVIKLHFYEKKSIRKIAKELHTTPSRVVAQEKKALSQLRRELLISKTEMK